MNFYKATYSLVLFLLLLIPERAGAVTIKPAQRIQASGSVRFSAIKNVPSGIVNWKAIHYYIDETSGVYSYPSDTLFASGDSVTFNLQKTSGKYTYYKVFAIEDGQSDSVTVQVFLPGVVQKYLYTNSSVTPYPIPVWIVIPNGYSVSSKLIVTMCGINRAASAIATYWVPFANTNKYIVLAPEFGTDNWSSDAYSRGNMFTGPDGTGTLNPKTKWSFYIVEQIQREMSSLCGIQDTTYILWGHSAGGQFVHRLAFFIPDNRVSMYIAANSGWYTCPDQQVIFPWGTLNTQLNLSQADLNNFTLRNLVIMRGTADTLRNSSLNTDPLSDAQGLNRYTRAGYFYNKGKSVNIGLRWKMVDVPDIGHSDQYMAQAAGAYLVSVAGTTEREAQPLSEKTAATAYPNPFSSVVNIKISLPVETDVKFRVYNIAGEKLVYVDRENTLPGVQNFIFDASGLPNGVYLCRLTGSGVDSAVKVMLLR